MSTGVKQGVLDLLHGLDLSWQKTRPVHPQANLKAQQAFKNTSPGLMGEIATAHPEADRLEVWFLDEARVGRRNEFIAWSRYDEIAAVAPDAARAVVKRRTDVGGSRGAGSHRLDPGAADRRGGEYPPFNKTDKKSKLSGSTSTSPRPCAGPRPRAASATRPRR